MLIAFLVLSGVYQVLILNITSGSIESKTWFL